MIITIFLIYMLVVSKLGLGLLWVDWVILILLTSFTFLKFSTEVAFLNRSSKIFDESKNKKTDFISKIT